MILPHPKIPGSKTKPTIWLLSKQADQVAEDKEREREKGGREGRKKGGRGRKNTDRIASKLDRGGTYGC